MFDQFFDFYFSYLNSFVYAMVNIIGIYGGSLLVKRTRNQGPLIVRLSCLMKLAVGLMFPMSNFLENRFLLDYEMMQIAWLTLSLLDLIATMLLLVGVVLIAQDFRARLDSENIAQSLPH